MRVPIAEMESSAISDFFSDRSVFLTGASGFLGKVIIEKLLRDCPNIKTIYILLRAKGGQDSRQRLRELLDSVVFERLQSENTSQLSKVVPINGDVTFPELGISLTDLATLVENVSIVIHSAATIRFDEPLR